MLDTFYTHAFFEISTSKGDFIYQFLYTCYAIIKYLSTIYKDLFSIFSPVVFTRGNALEFLLSSHNLGRLLRVDTFWSPIQPSRLGVGPPSIYIHSFRITNLETSYR